MNNPALKRLAKELKEIQQFKSKNREEPVNNLKSTETETDESQESSKNEPIEDDEDCIDAMPLKVPESLYLIIYISIGRPLRMAFHPKRPLKF